MRIKTISYYGIVTCVLLITPLLWNCGDQPSKKSKPLVVSKKISTQAAPVSDEVKDKAQKDEPAKNATPEKSDEPKMAATERIYDPAKRINPFTPLFKPDQNKSATPQKSKSKRKKRVPQTPLERISLEQLELRAIIRAPSGNRALVEDSSGKGYIIKKGTYIGLNSGIVTQVHSDSVIVEEEVENLMGELVLNNTEIKLQKQTGE